MAEVVKAAHSLEPTDTVSSPGGDLTVSTVEAAEIPTNLIGGGTVRGYKVTFTDETFTLYPAGSTVVVIE